MDEDHQTAEDGIGESLRSVNTAFLLDAVHSSGCVDIDVTISCVVQADRCSRCYLAEQNRPGLPSTDRRDRGHLTQG